MRACTIRLCCLGRTVEMLIWCDVIKERRDQVILLLNNFVECGDYGKMEEL